MIVLSLDNLVTLGSETKDSFSKLVILGELFKLTSRSGSLLVTRLLTNFFERESSDFLDWYGFHYLWALIKLSFALSSKFEYLGSTGSYIPIGGEFGPL